MRDDAPLSSASQPSRTKADAFYSATYQILADIQKHRKFVGETRFRQQPKVSGKKAYAPSKLDNVTETGLTRIIEPNERRPPRGYQWYFSITQEYRQNGKNWEISPYRQDRVALPVFRLAYGV